jgi:ferric-dicitrate binding protein FerR (iron transport regulator)
LKKKEKNKTEPEVDIKLIKKFLQKKCNHNEHELVLNWFTHIRYERKLKHIISEHWDEIELDPPDCYADTNRLLDKLHHLIHLDSYKKLRSLPFYRKVYKQFSKIAAVLLLPVLVISTWYFLTNGQFFVKEEKTIYAEIYSPLAARTRFELPDGSTGWLNSGSTLKFPVKFYGAQRKVELSGEGFFDVVKDSEKPFVVKTCNMDIKALGTRFNVLAYPDDETCEITLESGKVIIEKTRKSGEMVKLAELQPGHQIVISKRTYKSDVSEVVTEKYTSWKEGKLILRNDPMDVVVKRIGRWYNAEINLKNGELESYRYRATFEDETFSEVLKLLKLTSPIEYIEHKREMLPDGTFTKKEITFFLKPGYKEK